MFPCVSLLGLPRRTTCDERCTETTVGAPLAGRAAFEVVGDETMTRRCRFKLETARQRQGLAAR